MGAGRQADGLDESRIDDWMVKLQQSHVIVVAVFFIVGMLQDTVHFEGNLIVATGIQKVLAQVYGPDCGGNLTAEEKSGK